MADIDEYVRRVVDEAPALTDAQRMTLAAILNPRTIEHWERERLEAERKRQRDVCEAVRDEARRIGFYELSGLKEPAVSPAPRVGQRCALYRHFDPDGTLLYVGISVDPDTRNKQHGRDSKWHRFSTRVIVEWHESTDLAHRAEKRAIRNERPIFNKVHSDGMRNERALRYLVAQEAFDLLAPGI